VLGALEDILSFVENIPGYILYVAESFINLIFSGITAIFTFATSLISLPGIPSPPGYVSEINWFFPLGAVISVATPIVTGYTAFLLIRWVYQKTGNL
jgi:hypothetical protein